MGSLSHHFSPNRNGPRGLFFGGVLFAARGDGDFDRAEPITLPAGEELRRQPISWRFMPAGGDLRVGMTAATTTAATM